MVANCRPTLPRGNAPPVRSQESNNSYGVPGFLGLTPLPGSPGEKHAGPNVETVVQPIALMSCFRETVYE